MHADDELVQDVCDAAGRVVDRKLIAHVIDYHLPRPQRGPIQAVPFARMHIPDVECAQMAEVMQTDRLTLAEVAERFDRPSLLVERELKAYLRRHTQWTDIYAMQAL